MYAPCSEPGCPYAARYKCTFCGKVVCRNHATVDEYSMIPPYIFRSPTEVTCFSCSSSSVWVVSLAIVGGIVAMFIIAGMAIITKATEQVALAATMVLGGDVARAIAVVIAVGVAIAVASAIKRTSQ